MINFNKLSRPTSVSAPLDPLEIFAKTPNLKDAPNDLWKGQAEALIKWHASRKENDNVITLNTGAGKCIVGILIAQSLVNEQFGPVVFVCSTIDLIHQTSKECDRLGIKYTTRIHNVFSNDLYEIGRAFCITTYQALFSAINAFKNQNAPAGVIFDDAHVAERLIRDAFTLNISRSQYTDLFNQIVEIVRPHFNALNKGPHLNYIVEGIGQQYVTLCPPNTAHRCREQIVSALKRADYRNHSDLLFPTVQLYEHIQHCAIFISSHNIEITPPFIPTGIFPFLRDGVRRVYLSATLEYETDFVRGFGRRIVNHINPDNDAGNGERLILFATEFDKDVEPIPLARAIMQKQKLLVSVPSYPKAKAWVGIANPLQADRFSSELNIFRQAKSGAFILVSRIDGIDLPQDTCRIMLIDGAPSGASLMERYLFQQLDLSNLHSTKMASRIAQLFGRINRGRSDYGVFILFGRDINLWLKKERNVALLPHLIRKQIILGQSLQKDIGKIKSNELASVVNQVLSRDAGWLDFYRDTIDALEVSSEMLERVREREALLAASAVAECKFMTLLWQENREEGRKAILDVLDSTALADARLAGWYSLWLGMTYENDGDSRTSIAHYKRARSRLSSWLVVPFRSESDFQDTETGEKTVLQERLLSINYHGPQALGDLIAKMKIAVRTIADVKASSSQHEEAFRMFGELIGFRANRPDNELGVGPDVIWADDVEKTILAVELKTKKDNPARYNKEEIGQIHNHLQWLQDEFSDFKCDGILIIGPTGICTKEANPSAAAFLVETSNLISKLQELIAKIEDTRGRINIDRW